MKDPFELVGQSILVVLSNEAFCQIYMFGEPVPGNDGPWLVSGRVASDVPGIGLWISVSGILSPSGKSANVAASGQVDPTYLVRWDQILSARISPVQFKDVGRVGFSPRLP